MPGANGTLAHPVMPLASAKVVVTRTERSVLVAQSFPSHRQILKCLINRST